MVDIYDPACKVQDLVIRTFEAYQKGNKPGELTRNCVNHSHNYVTIGAHAPTAADKLELTKDGKLTVPSPKENVMDPSEKSTTEQDDIFAFLNNNSKKSFGLPMPIGTIFEEL